MENVANTAPPPPSIVFTDAAAGKVGELISEEDNPNLKLRVFISGGGCSGFSTALRSTRASKTATARSRTRALRC